MLSRRMPVSSTSPAIPGRSSSSIHAGGPNLTKERVKDLVGAFLEGREDWQDGLEWELTEHAPRDARWRVVRLVLIGVTVVALMKRLTGFLAR
jgi:hypothetical protein